MPAHRAARTGAALGRPARGPAAVPSSVADVTVPVVSSIVGARSANSGSTGRIDMVSPTEAACSQTSRPAGRGVASTPRRSASRPRTSLPRAKRTRNSRRTPGAAAVAATAHATPKGFRPRTVGRLARQRRSARRRSSARRPASRLGRPLSLAGKPPHRGRTASAPPCGPTSAAPNGAWFGPRRAAPARQTARQAAPPRARQPDAGRGGRQAL